MLFSQRIGKRPVKSTVQVDSMDQDLRNGLWNAFQICVGEKIPALLSHSQAYESFFSTLWHSFYKAPIDDMPQFGSQVISGVRKWFFKANYLQVYDFVEFVLQTLPECFDPLTSRQAISVPNAFRKICNDVLQREISAYRFVGNQLAPITNELELGAIEDAVSAAGRGKFKGVQAHLEQALALMSDRKAPDYRNSIKESISAVESIVRVITGDASITLGKGLAPLDQKIGLHPAMKKAFSDLYGYTSDEGGIRHGMMEDAKCDFEDAKYMLVTCSAFVNFLVGKAAMKGIKL